MSISTLLISFFELIPLGCFCLIVTWWYWNVQTDNQASLYVVWTGHFLCAVDATITWTLPSPQRGPVTIADPKVRTTLKVFDGRSPELRLEWNFTLSSESLVRVSWKRGANERIGTKSSSGAVTLFSTFQGQFNISPNDPATLIIYNTTAADEEKITCSVVTDLSTWDDVILVVLHGERSFCCLTLFMHMYVYA